MSECHNRNVYILGAGFSAPAGAPVIRDFLDRSREFLDDPRSSLDQIERQQFGDVFDFRREMAQAREKIVMDLDDIEQLFGLVEISDRLGVGEDTEKTRNSTVYLIAKTLQLATTWPKCTRPRIGFSVKPQIYSQLGDHSGVFTAQSNEYFMADMYDHFAALLAGLLDEPDRRPGRKDSVITFNYDLVLDHAIKRIGAALDYHLEPQLCATAQAEDNAKRVSVLKLHGSANWAVCTRCRKSVFVLDEKVTEDPSLLRRRNCRECKAQGYHPLLVPPSWEKSEYREIIKSVWSAALRELTLAKRICVIGYSMPETDLFFKYLLTLSLSQNHGLYKLIVVDLDPPAANRSVTRPATRSSKSLKERYEDLLEPVFRERRFSIHTNGVQNFLANTASYAELGRGDGLGASINLY